MGTPPQRPNAMTMERRRQKVKVAILAAAAALVLVCIDRSDPSQSLRSPVEDRARMLGAGPWTEDEHKAFLRGLEKYGKLRPNHPWHESLIPTRSLEEVRAHTREYGARRDDPAYVPHVKNPWTPQEHALFLEGLGDHGLGHGAHGKTAEKVGTRSFEEVRAHAVEYFTDLARGETTPREVFRWPSKHEARIPPGTYFRPGHRRGWLETLRSYGVAQPAYGRVLLYISTHFSDQHEMYLRYCWKNVLARSLLLQGADVAVHLTPNDSTRKRAAMGLLKEVFTKQNLMVYLRNYEGVLLEGGTEGKEVKQTGAAMTMVEAVEHDYFKGYDWVIRVNPDVLIRDDSYFQKAMAKPELSALLINCHQGEPTPLHLHTDFFVVRPEVLKEKEFPRQILEGGAEMSFTASMRNTVIKSSPPNFEWIPRADPLSHRTCRAGEGRDFFSSPVVHEHVLHPNICSVPEADKREVKRVMNKWPKSWEPVH